MFQGEIVGTLIGDYGVFRAVQDQRALMEVRGCIEFGRVFQELVAQALFGFGAVVIDGRPTLLFPLLDFRGAQAGLPAF